MMADKIKSIYWNPQEGRNEQREITAYEIVKSPNYHKPEAIIAAICHVIAELADCELERRDNVNKLMQGFSKQKDVKNETEIGTAQI